MPPESIDPVFAFAPSSIVDNGLTVHCPSCDGGNLHIGPGRFVNGYDAGKASPWVRGDVSRTPLYCERCNMDLVGYVCIGFHKGETVIWCEPVARYGRLRQITERLRR